MAIRFLFLPFKGVFEFVLVPPEFVPTTGGTALFADTTGIKFIDGTDMDWIN